MEQEQPYPPVIDTSNDTDKVKEYIEHLNTFVMIDQLDPNTSEEDKEKFEHAAWRLEQLWFKELSDEEQETVERYSALYE